MARRKAAVKNAILPDPLFESQMVARFINVVMRSGKKSVAEKIVYKALDMVVSKQQAKEGHKQEASIKDSANSRKIGLDFFEKVLHVVRPTVHVKTRRVGGANYQVPVEVKEDLGIALAMRWLVDCAKRRSEKSMYIRLANEILDALEGKGGALKKREDTHKMAKANQAFAHYRW